MKIVKLSEEKNNLEFFGRFLSMKEISIDAFAERLLQELLSHPDLEQNLDLLRVICDSGVDVNATDFRQMSVLEIVCIQTRDVALCQFLLEMGADVDYQDNYDKTPLSWACEKGIDAVAELFLKHGADVDISDEYDLFPLAYAFFECSSTTIARLLDHADYGPHQLPSLETFIAECDYSKVNRILEFDATSKFYRPRTTVATFIHAACKGEIELLNFARTLQPTIFEELKGTPWVLFEAAAFGLRDDEPDEDSDANTIAVVEYLRKNGFDIRSVDESGRGSSVVFAILNGRTNLAQHLLKAGARVESFANGDWILSKTTDDLVPLPGKSSTMLEVLGVVDVTPENWRHYCTFIYDAEDRVKDFLRNYVKQLAPIHAAAVCKDDSSGQLTRLLLSRGADPNQTIVKLPFQSADWADTQLITALQTGIIQNNPTTRFTLGICCHHSKRLPCFLVPNPLQMALRRGGVEPFRYLLNARAQLPDTLSATGCCTCASHVSVHTSSTEDLVLSHGDVGSNSLHDTSSHEFWNDEFGRSWFDQDTSNDIGHENDLYGTEERVCVIGNHDTNDEHCRYSDECWWNPLFQVKEEGLFYEVFKTMSSTHRELWVTRIISSRVADACEWDFVSRLLDDGMIPEEHAYQQDFLVKSVCAKDERWVGRILEKGNLSKNTAQLGFMLAAQEGYKSLLEIFLNFGYWPDDKVKAENFRYLQHHVGFDGLRRSPLSLALLIRDDMIMTVFTDHYRAKSHERHSTDVSSHFAQAYGDAIVRGDTETAKLLMHEERVNDVVYSSHKVDWTGNENDSNCTAGPYHDCELPIRNFRSSIQLAAAFGQYGVVRWLLAQGADPNIADENQNSLEAYHSPLQCAARDKEVSNSLNYEFAKRLTSKQD